MTGGTGPGPNDRVAAVLAEVLDRLAGGALALFCDFDGTLAPIVDDPDDVELPPATRAALGRLASRGLVAIVSGRATADVMARVGLPGVHYAGAHGMEIVSPGGAVYVHPDVAPFRDVLGRAAAALRAALAGIPGALVEDKHWTVAAHCRMVAPAERPRVRSAVEDVAADHPSLRITEGRLVRELRPDVDWDKGRAVLWLLERFAPPPVLAVYLGDDVTDEDAFGALRGRGLGIRVEGGDHDSAAELSLPDTGAVGELLVGLEAALRPAYGGPPPTDPPMARSPL